MQICLRCHGVEIPTHYTLIQLLPQSFDYPVLFVNAKIKKGRVSVMCDMKVYGESGGIAPFIFNNGTGLR
jgi:hypothetical protein